MKKTIMRGSTSKEGFYLKKEKSNSPGIYDFWIGYKNDGGDIHEQRITELAYIILMTENKKMGARKKY